MKINWEDRYKIKEFHRHGEAASVEPMLVETERRHMREVLAPFAQKDRWNFDKSSFFAFAPLDCGFVTPHGLSALSCTYIPTPCVPPDRSYQTLIALLDLRVI